MGNINRTDDVSQQQEIYSLNAFGGFSSTIAAINSGSTIYCGTIIPRQMQIQQAQATSFGVSGAPQLLLGCLRFSNGTSFVIGTTMLVPAYGTSGYLPYSLGTAGSTTLNLVKGDVLVMQQLGGASAATTGVMMSVVVKNLQDFKTWY